MSWLVNDELEWRVWMKLVVVQFMVLCLYLPGVWGQLWNCSVRMASLWTKLELQTTWKQSKPCKYHIQFSLLFSHILIKGLVIRSKFQYFPLRWCFKASPFCLCFYLFSVLTQSTYQVVRPHLFILSLLLAIPFWAGCSPSWPYHWNLFLNCHLISFTVFRILFLALLLLFFSVLLLRNII